MQSPVYSIIETCRVRLLARHATELHGRLVQPHHEKSSSSLVGSLTFSLSSSFNPRVRYRRTDSLFRRRLFCNKVNSYAQRNLWPLSLLIHQLTCSSTSVKTFSRRDVSRSRSRKASRWRSASNTVVSASKAMACSLSYKRSIC